MVEHYADIKNTDVCQYMLTWEDVQEIKLGEESMFKNFIFKLHIKNMC